MQQNLVAIEFDDCRSIVLVVKFPVSMDSIQGQTFAVDLDDW